MKQSESITKLADALVKAQAEMPEIPMDGINPHYKSKFSTLGAVISAVRPVFAKHGLVVLQLPSGSVDGFGLATRILHSSGEWIESELTMAIPAGQNPGQEVGKLVTYLRRYGLAAAAGVYSDEDTDNEGKQQVKTAKVTAPPVPETDNTKMVGVLDGETIKHVVALKLFENEKAAAQVLSRFKPAKAPLGKIVEKARLYRGHKDSGKDTEAAINSANNGEAI